MRSSHGIAGACNESGGGPDVESATYDPFADYDEPIPADPGAGDVRSVTRANVRSSTSTSSNSTDIERRATGRSTDNRAGNSADKALVGVRTSCVRRRRGRRVVIIVFASGRVMRLVKDCDLWGCTQCSRRKSKAIAARLETVLDGADAHAADLTLKQWKAASPDSSRVLMG